MGQGVSISNTQPTDDKVYSMNEAYEITVYESGTVGIKAAQGRPLRITINCHGNDGIQINVLNENRLRINNNWLLTRHHLGQNYTTDEFELETHTFLITLTDSEAVRRIDVRHELRTWATLLVRYGKIITAGVQGDELCSNMQNLLEEVFERGRSSRFATRQRNYDFGMAIGVTPRETRIERERERATSEPGNRRKRRKTKRYGQGWDEKIEQTTSQVPCALQQQCVKENNVLCISAVY